MGWNGLTSSAFLEYTLNKLNLDNFIAWVRSYEASAGKLQPVRLKDKINSDHRRLSTDGHMGM